MMLSCFSTGLTNAGPCGTVTANCPGGVAMVERLLKKITYWEEKPHFFCFVLFT